MLKYARAAVSARILRINKVEHMKNHDKKAIRFLKGVLAAALSVSAVSALVSCGNGIKPKERTEEESRVMGTCSGQTVYYDEVRWCTLNTRDDMAAEYGSEIWTDAALTAQYRDELNRRVREAICNDYHAVYAMADEYYLGGGAAMFSEEKIVEAVNESVNSTAEEAGGKKEYFKGLEEAYLTDALFRFCLTAEKCATELMYILQKDLGLLASSDEEFDAFLHSDSFARTNHVYLKGLTDENLALAGSIRDSLLASQDPESELILYKGRYDSDFTLTTTHGAYFARYTSDYGNAYEQAAFALKVGEISDVVKGTGGYYVIMRLPVEDSWLKSNYESFCDDVVGSQFNVMLAQVKARLSFEPSEAFGALDLTSIQ